MTETQTEIRPELLIVGGNTGSRSPSAAVASEAVGRAARVLIADDRQAALAMLRGASKHALADVPSLILLDVDEGSESAWLLLEEIKSDAKLKRIPVIVTSAAVSLDKREQAYRLQANSYVSYEADAVPISLIEQVRDFWLSRVRLPSARDM
jgi:CheY-like chemotaxis protein